MGLEKEKNYNMATNGRVLRKIDQLSKHSVYTQVKCRATFYLQPEGFSEHVGKAPVHRAAHAWRGYERLAFVLLQRLHGLKNGSTRRVQSNENIAVQ